MRAHRWLGIGLIALGAGLAANSLLGPLIADVIRYPLSETLLSQTMGLDAVSLILVAPVSIAAGILALRGHVAGPVLGFGPAAYTWYMFLQYVVGPEYAYYPGALPLHLGLFALSGAVGIAAWSAIRADLLPEASRRTDRLRGLILLGLAAFLAFRYVPMLLDAAGGKGLTAEAREGLTMFWSILLLDLGIVLPATVATAVGVLVGAAWGSKALHSLVGWWAFVPASVAAMAIVMVVNDDPHAAVGQTVVFVAGAILFAVFAVRVYWPLLHRHPAGAAGRRGRPKVP